MTHYRIIDSPIGPLTLAGHDGVLTNLRMVDQTCDWTRAREQLLDIPGVGPWTAEVIAMRGLGDPDAFPVADLGVRLAAKQLGLPQRQPGLLERSARWRPWRSYATQHLWTTLEHSVNDWPPREVA